LATRRSRGRRARFSLRAVARGWPWYYETTAVFPNEILLRTVPNSIGYYSQSMGIWAVNPTAFEPRTVDVDGISLYREDFVTKKYLASVSGYPTGVRVASVTAKDCTNLHLSLQPSPDPKGPSGHLVIPEMAFVKKTPQTKDLKRKIQDLAQKLAQIASKNEIYTPPGLVNPLNKAS
jgi:hypothetical protein